MLLGHGSLRGGATHYLAAKRKLPNGLWLTQCNRLVRLSFYGKAETVTCQACKAWERRQNDAG